jgi:hypothetical protein
MIEPEKRDALLCACVESHRCDMVAWLAARGYVMSENLFASLVMIVDQSRRPFVSKVWMMKQIMYGWPWLDAHCIA